MGVPCIRSQTCCTIIRIHHQNHSSWFIIPELDLVSPVGNGAISGVRDVVEEVVEL